MQKYLLDTNIISEIAKEQPNKGVITFLSSLDMAWLSAITTHEIDYGLFLLADGKKRAKIHNVISEFISKYSNYILPVGQIEGEISASFRAKRKKEGKPINIADSLIAGTAYVHNLTIATRNIKDFQGIDVEVFNPFD